jgi:hypothetical protein
MNRHRLHLAILIVLFGAFATGAGAQSTAGAMPASPESAATAAAKGTTGGLPAKPKTAGTHAGTHAGTRAYHASAPKAKHARPAHHEKAMSVSAAESASRAALRRCVAGPTAARDECLDQAVAQHARGDGRVV